MTTTESEYIYQICNLIDVFFNENNFQKLANKSIHLLHHFKFDFL